MNYCVEHDCFKVFYGGEYVCPRHEAAAGNGTIIEGRWIVAEK